MLPRDFDPQPVLRGHGLILRPLTEPDREALYVAASDPGIWAGHPSNDRHERAVFDPYFDTLLASRATLLVTLEDSAEVIGASRFYTAADAPGDVSIGFTFLIRAHWGGVMNRRLKDLMLSHIFRDRDRAWFHIDPTNIRSQKATAKLGAMRAADQVLDLGAGPVRWMCYRLDRDIWLKRRGDLEF